MAPIPLPKRATHIFFLRRLALERIPNESKTYGELTTAEVVRLFIRPSTATAKTSFMEAMLTQKLVPKHHLSWCASGTMRDTDGVVQQAFGPSRFFASHAWSYKFGALVSMLDTHYSQLPGTKGGGRFLPVYYWVDILAVTQHFTGDFKDHPDSDFAGVIKAAKSVLFTMHPWRSPIAPTRVWCLFEALTAIQAPGVEFEVVVDVKDSKDTRVQTVTVISGSIDVRTAQATVSSDKAYILSCIDQGIGVNAFNNAIRKRLKEALLQAITPNAVEMGDTAALHELLKIGGCVRPDGIADLASCFRFGNESDMMNVMRNIQIRDIRPRGLVLSGKQRTKEVTLSDGGLRGWDGESFSLREYGELDTGRIMWPYLPISPALCQAVGDLLVMPTSSGAGATSSNLRGIEDLWISLRSPKPDDFAKPQAAGNGLGSAPNSPMGPNGFGGGSALPLLRDGSMRSSGSFTGSAPAAAALRQELSRAGGASFSGGLKQEPSRAGGASFSGVAGGPSLRPELSRNGGASFSSSGGPGGGGLRSELSRSGGSSFSSPGGPPGLRQELSRGGGASFTGGGGSGLGPERSGLGLERSSGSFSGPPGSATAARAAARAIAASPGKRRPPSALSLTGSATMGGRPTSASMLSFLDSPSGGRGAPTPTAARGASSLMAPAPPSGPAPPPGSRPASARPVSSRPASISGTPVSLLGTGSGGSGGVNSPQRHVSCTGALGMESSVLSVAPGSPQQHQQQQQQKVDLPPGRPALWAAVGFTRTLRMLCLHQSVLVPPDVHLLAAALQSNKTVEILQFVKCVAPGAEASGVHATARLTAELLALGLSCGTLRQLHVRPADPVYIEAMPACTPPGKSCLRRVSLTPAALSPAAIRSLGRSLAALPQMHSLVSGLDPAPFVTWMPKETHERDHWLAYEDKVEPEMAARRRKHMGVDEDGLAAFVAHAWDFRDELATLPDADRGGAAIAQRAAAISFFLVMACGSRDLGPYNRRYARWAWARRGQPEEGLAEMKKNFGACKELAAEMLRAAPEAFSSKFDASKREQRSAKTRLQATFFELYG